MESDENTTPENPQANDNSSQVPQEIRPALEHTPVQAEPSHPALPTLATESKPENTDIKSQIVTSGPGGRRGAKSKILALVLILVLAGAGFAAYKMWLPTDNDKTLATKSTVTKQDIPEIKLGAIDATISFYKPNDTNSYDQTINAQIYEGLVSYKDRIKVVPALATGWTNPNETTWDFDLRKGVTFHNGHTLTAADVVYSLKEAMKAGEDGTYSSTIKDVKAINDYKVEVTTAKHDPFLLNKLTLLMITDSKTPGVNDGTDGTGPYQVKPGTKPTDKEMQLFAFDKFHGGHVSTRALTIISEPDLATMVADFKSGKVNMAGEFKNVNPEELTGVTHTDVKMLDPAVHFMTMNTVAAGPLQKKEVRQALRESLDLSSVLKNPGIAADPATQLVSKEIPGYNPALTVPKQDIENAKKLLATAGYPNGVSLELQTSNVPVTLAIAGEIAKQAKLAGFNITVKQVPDFDELLHNFLGGKAQLAMLSYGSDVLDASDVFGSVIQQSNFTSKTFDDYMAQVGDATSESQRLQVLQKTSKYVNDEVAVIPLYTQYRVWETDKPYVLPYDNLNSALGVTFWQAYLPK